MKKIYWIIKVIDHNIIKYYKAVNEYTTCGEMAKFFNTKEQAEKIKRIIPENRFSEIKIEMLSFDFED